MHLELDEENNKLILTHTKFTDKDKQEYISHNEAVGRSWFIARLLNFMIKEAIGK
jgi:hypothetical protein